MSLFDDLNLDPESATWEDFASCKGLDSIDPNLFYDTYEEDVFIAKSVDLICSRCPVIQACHNAAKSKKEWGVWGGYYLTDGKVDRVRNKHKDPAIKKSIEDRLNV